MEVAEEKQLEQKPTMPYNLRRRKTSEDAKIKQPTPAGPGMKKCKILSPQRRQSEHEDFCCGEKQFYNPLPMNCINGCVIGPYAIFRNYKNEYVFCEKCFTGKKGKEIEVSEGLSIKKALFERKENDEAREEPVVECCDCGTKMHQICALHHSTICDRFKCTKCFEGQNIDRMPQKTAEDLPRTCLSNHIERKLYQFLDRNNIRNKVYVRVVVSEDAEVILKPNLVKKYEPLYTTYPYRNKMIFAFEEIDGVDVAFFAFIVQEYYFNCPPPNRGCVYLAYLDSVQIFQPRDFRTRVYQTILLSYLEYAKSLGFESAYIWACPPGPASGMDYIFFSHPLDMKMPQHSRLQAWYKNLLQEGQNQGIVLNYSNLLTHSLELKISSVIKMPYFDGDHWPALFEELIAEEMEAQKTFMPENFFKLRKRKKAKGKLNKRRSLLNVADEYTSSLPLDGLMSRVVAEMYAHNNMFLVAHLNNSEEDRKIVDPDKPHPCEILQTRDIFLHFLRERNFEFSSLRKAKFSTVGLLSELHLSNRSLITCNICNNNICNKDRYVCEVCDDFDICRTCLQNGARYHPHPLIVFTKQKDHPIFDQDSLMDEQDHADGHNDLGVKEILTTEEKNFVFESIFHAYSTCTCPGEATPSCKIGNQILYHMNMERCKMPFEVCEICVQFCDMALERMESMKSE